MSTSSIQRLSTVPWACLQGLSGQVTAALAEVLAGAAAERVLDRLLRRLRLPDDAARRAVAEALFGVGLWRRRLAFHVRPDGRPRALLFALLHVLADVPAADAARWSGLDALPPVDARLPDDLATRWSLPDWLAADVAQAAPGDEAHALAEALNQPGPVCLRPNRLVARAAEVADALAGEGISTRTGTWKTDALVVTSPRPNVLALEAFRRGLFEVQDEGSQLLGALVDPRPGETLLDLCAGAGGKTLQLASLLGGGGRVHAHDVDRARLDRLRVRAARAGVGQLTVHEHLPADLLADAVLVDAPCSELGALRRGPDLRFRLDPGAFAALPDLQRALLDRAARHTRPGGRVVYGTCTWRPAENEDVVLAFLAAHPGWSLLPALTPPALRRGPFLSVSPHRHGTDGFFGAVLRRSMTAG